MTRTIQLGRRARSAIAGLGGLALIVGAAATTEASSAATPEPRARPMALPAVATSPDAGRLDELATATSDTYVQADGSYQYVGYTTPVNYLADDGNWQPIDNELVPSPGETFAVENAENNYTVRMPEDASADPVRVVADGQWISFEMDGLDGAPGVDDSEATYAFDGPDAREVIYEARPDGVKESIVLDQPPADDLAYAFEIELSAGLTPRLRTRGDIDVVDAAGRQVFTMPAPFMIDADGAVSTNVSYALTKSANGWQLVVSPADGWLRDPNRAYPVIIDPTVTTTPSTDGWIAEASPTNVNGGGQYLRVGGAPGSRRRALLKFDITSIPSTAHIQSTDGSDPALLKLYLDSSLTSGGGNSGLIAGRVKSAQTWAPGWLSWNDRAYQTPWETPGGAWGDPSPAANFDANSGHSGYKSIDVLGIVEKWVNENYANDGFIAKQSADRDTQMWFHSVNTTSGYPPKLVIKYQPDQPPNQPTNLVVGPGGPGYTATDTPQLSAFVSDPDDDQVDSRFAVTYQGQEIWDETVTVQSGTTATTFVPPGILSSGKTYTVSVAASSRGASSGAATQTVQIDDQAATSAAASCNSLPGCTTLNDIVFSGVVAANTTQTVDLASVLAGLPGHGFAHLLIHASSPGPTDLRLYTSGAIPPVAPTLQVAGASGAESVAVVAPSPSQNVSLRNGASPATITVTVVGWESWDLSDQDDFGETEGVGVTTRAIVREGNRWVCRLEAHRPHPVISGYPGGRDDGVAWSAGVDCGGSDYLMHQLCAKLMQWDPDGGRWFTRRGIRCRPWTVARSNFIGRMSTCDTLGEGKYRTFARLIVGLQSQPQVPKMTVTSMGERFCVGIMPSA